MTIVKEKPNKVQENVKQLHTLLITQYPEKILPNVNQLKEQDKNIRSLLGKLSRRQSKTEKDIILELGFHIDGGIKKYSRVKYKMDLDALERLQTEYTTTYSELGRIFGISRQGMKVKMSNNSINHPKYWQKEHFTDKESALIISIIKNLTFTYENQDTYIQIFKHKTKEQEFAIMFKTKDKVKCSFDLSPTIKKQLQLYKFDQFEQNDFDILKEIEKSQYVQPNGVIKIPSNTDLSRKINNQVCKNGLTKCEYMEFLGGWKYIEARFRTDEEIKMELKQYLDKNGYIHIPSRDERYHRFVMVSRNRGYKSLQEMIISFGFKPKNQRRIFSIENVKKEIKRYVVKENKVYIDFNDPLYLYLHRKSKSMNKTMDSLLKEWGYERICKRQVPHRFVPARWDDN